MEPGGGAAPPGGWQGDDGRGTGERREADDGREADFEALEVGQSASLTRTVTETDVVLFAGLTGDMNPLHVDREAARRSRFGGRIAHGMLVAGLVSAVLGTRLPGPGCIYVSQSLRFVGPVGIGDTVTARAEIIELIPDRRRVRLRTTCENQEGEPVLEGEAELLVP